MSNFDRFSERLKSSRHILINRGRASLVDSESKSVLGPRATTWIKTATLLVSIALISLFRAANGQPADSRPPAPRRPSIILILADGLGYGDLGCYGQTKIKTPNIDKLAAEGIRFTDFYSGSSVSAPSRCVLMTGLHTGHAAIRGNGSEPLGPADTTIAELLQRAGYRTGLIGEWGLGRENTSGVPQKKGFEQFLGYLDPVHAHDYYTYQLWRFDGRNGYDGMESFSANAAGRRGLYIPDLFTTAALNFLRINKPDRFNQYRPFFLELAYTIPHPNTEEAKRTGNGMQVPSDALYANESWPQIEKNKAAMLTSLDADVGQLLDKLKQLKMDENTIILLTSDSGPSKESGVDPAFFQSSGPLRGVKGTLYEGGLRVPLVARWPARIKPGRVSDLVCGFQDFMPTACGLAGIALPQNIDGLSLAPTLRGQSQTNRHDFLYWELHEQGFQQALRMGEWKAIRSQTNQPVELYNLKTDLAEKHDVAAEHPEILSRLEKFLKTARTESPQWPTQARAGQTAPAVEKKLPAPGSS